MPIYQQGGFSPSRLVLQKIANEQVSDNKEGYLQGLQDAFLSIESHEWDFHQILKDFYGNKSSSWKEGYIEGYTEYTSPQNLANTIKDNLPSNVLVSNTTTSGDKIIIIGVNEQAATKLSSEVKSLGFNLVEQEGENIIITLTSSLQAY